MNKGSDLKRSLRGAKVTAAGHLFSWVNTVCPRLMKKSPCNAQQMNQKNAAAFFPCESGVLLLPCDCFLHLRRICGSANKLFMAAYCCSAPTFCLLTHSKLSPSPLSLFKLKAPFFYSTFWLSTPLLFALFPSSGLNLCPTSQEAPSFTSSRETKSDFKNSPLLHFCLSLSLPPLVCIFSPLPHTSSSMDTVFMCAFGKGEEVEGLAREGLGWGGVGWGVGGNIP